jgi:hypothetical protein
MNDERKGARGNMPFILIIGERSNSWAGRPSRATMHASRQEAESEVLAFVQRNWDSELGNDERPDDADEMIEYYFENVPERYEIVFAESQA